MKNFEYFARIQMWDRDIWDKMFVNECRTSRFRFPRVNYISICQKKLAEWENESCVIANNSELNRKQEDTTRITKSTRPNGFGIPFAQVFEYSSGCAKIKQFQVSIYNFDLKLVDSKGRMTEHGFFFSLFKLFFPFVTLNRSIVQHWSTLSFVLIVFLCIIITNSS